MKSSVCNHEVARIEALYQYQILDSAPEQAFDDLVFLAAQICDAPIALINLLDTNRQWFKAKVGLDIREMPIDIGFCRLCIQQKDILIIPDTLADEQYATNVVVTSEPYVRFYVGVPLIVAGGQAIATLCVVDRISRQITPKQLKALQSISRLIIKQLEMRRSLLELTSIQSEYKETPKILCHSESTFLVVDTDITQKQELEQQFLRAQRMESIGTLASGIAHDLNNVLSPILMSVQLLQSKCRDRNTQQILSIIENNTKRGTNLVKQVLSFVQGIEGDFPGKPAPNIRNVIQIKHLILEIQQIVQQTFPQSIVLSTEIQPNLLPIRGDSTQLYQVLINLCLNARDAMPDGGNLTISAENIFIDENHAKTNLDAKVGSYICLTVTDTGLGISGEIIDKIFDPFFTTKEFGKGTGLGLSTVMGIVKGHGGLITVSSCVGKGTQFQVYLPHSVLPS
ncbi:GAF domain-containing protein [Nostocales cyanobacterium LEGE 11386]|nr:GAF domain-containing protein [Nostocales cyanobacterium LEGE 11386]